MYLTSRDRDVELSERAARQREWRLRQTQPAGRVCEEDGCATILSVYNDSYWCALHEGVHAF